MSFGTPVKLVSFHHAIEALHQKNVIMVSSAGNDWDNACNKAPAFYKEVITAAATDSEDACTGYTNMGTCVNLFAPGSSVSSTYNRDKWDQVTFSGTSASSAHVAGVVALLLEMDPHMNQDEIMEVLLAVGEKDAVQSIPEETKTPNVLLNIAS
jgi:serine protease